MDWLRPTKKRLLILTLLLGLLSVSMKIADDWGLLHVANLDETPLIRTGISSGEIILDTFDRVGQGVGKTLAPILAQSGVGEGFNDARNSLYSAAPWVEDSFGLAGSMASGAYMAVDTARKTTQASLAPNPEQRKQRFKAAAKLRKLQDDLATKQASVDTLNDEMNTLEDEIHALQKQLSPFQSFLPQIQGRVSTQPDGFALSMPALSPQPHVNVTSTTAGALPLTLPNVPVPNAPFGSGGQNGRNGTHGSNGGSGNGSGNGQCQCP